MKKREKQQQYIISYTVIPMRRSVKCEILSNIDAVQFSFIQMRNIVRNLKVNLKKKDSSIDKWVLFMTDTSTELKS